MKKLFVSMPMANLSEEEIKAKFLEAKQKAEELSGCEYELIDTFITENLRTPLAYLAKSLELLSQADAVYFCEGWQFARGCVLERIAAKSYGLNILGFTHNMELIDTIPGMFSPDYKERFISEYSQLQIRNAKLMMMLEKFQNGTLNFVPTCSYGLLFTQHQIMVKLLKTLQERSEIEKVELPVIDLMGGA